MIDADALKTRVAEETKIAEGLGVEMAFLARTMRDCIYEELENSPTIEAEPIRRGRWEVVDETEPRRYGCSECKRLSWWETNYCSYCGARMEVEND